MAKHAAIKGLLATGLVAGGLVLGLALPAWADPRIAQILAYTPTYKDVPITTPAPEDQAKLELKILQGQAKGSSGFLLVDAKGQSLRRFSDTNGDKQIDVWSYFKDGVEVYREVDSNFNKKPDQFRWLNGAGMKWGVSSQESGKIDYWRMISAEEVGQEIFHSLATKDFERLQALFISEKEMRMLKLPTAEAQRVLQAQSSAESKFKDVVAKSAGLDASAILMKVELGAPNCVPADSLGTEQDIIKYAPQTILYETADKKHEWLQTGEMIQVGLAWRLAEAPGLPAGPGGPTEEVNPALRKHLAELDNHDKAAPQLAGQPKTDKSVQDHYVKRVELIQQIIKADRAENRETWIKQIADSLSTASQADSGTATQQLVMLKDQIVQSMPGSKLAAYISFREMWAKYAPKIAKSKNAVELGKLQEEWHEQLAKFAQTYPNADDTPEALHQLAMDCEFNGKDEQAKRWYQQIHSGFPAHYLSAKAKGAERRLSLIGQPIELTGPQLGGGGAFDLATTKGKVVVVYYWTSKISLCRTDFQILKQLQTAYGPKGFEIVTVSLDDTAQEANAFVQSAQLTAAAHLFEAGKEGGLSSPLALQYGISGLPNVFLIGRDGRVLNRTLQINDLESELKKAL